MRSFNGSDVAAMCKLFGDGGAPIDGPETASNVGDVTSYPAYHLLDHVPDGDRDQNDDAHAGAVAHPLWYCVPHSSPPFVRSSPQPVLPAKDNGNLEQFILSIDFSRRAPDVAAHPRKGRLFKLAGALGRAQVTKRSAA